MGANGRYPDRPWIDTAIATYFWDSFVSSLVPLGQEGDAVGRSLAPSQSQCTLRTAEAPWRWAARWPLAGVDALAALLGSVPKCLNDTGASSEPGGGGGG